MEIICINRIVATKVGSAGISLSGGQKQRIALARAVYSKPELIVLDDVCSGLDAETELQIFDRLFSIDGLLRRMNITVLLVTHTVSRLAYSDHVIVLNEQGQISEQGSFSTLRSSGGYVQSLESKLKESKSDKSPGEGAGATMQIVADAAAQEDEIDAMTEELSRQTGDLQVYKHYFATIGWWHTAAFLAAATVYGTSNKFTEFLVIYCEYNESCLPAH